MNFYRHRLEDSVGTDFRNIMPANLDSWGFCLVDDSPITSANEIIGGVSSTNCFKWKYDSTSTANTFYHTLKCAAANTPGFLLFNGAGNAMTSINTNTFFFIPLKNKGFILRSELSDTLSLTPAFRPYKYYAQSQWGYSEQYPMNTIVGLFESNISNPMIYLQMGENVAKALLDPETLIPYYWTDSKHSYPNYRFDFIIGSQLIAFPNFIEDPHCYGIGDTTHNPNYIPTEWSFTENKYTDTIQNVCTLIRAPYENQYLDNLYIVTTKPCDTIDGKVFSFDGRNFLGIYDNLAVELPAN
jgi:hypothetical protein